MSSALSEREGIEGTGKPPLVTRTQYQYTNEEIGNALALLEHNSGNALRTARELGIPRSTIQLWSTNVDRLPPGAVSVWQAKREYFAQLSDEASEWIVTSITDEDVRKASLLQKVTSYAILREKAALDRGQATQVVAHVEAKQSAEQALERLFELARERDPAITREEVAERLCERRPELRPLLLEGNSTP